MSRARALLLRWPVALWLAACGAAPYPAGDGDRRGPGDGAAPAADRDGVDRAATGRDDAQGVGGAPRPAEAAGDDGDRPRRAAPRAPFDPRALTGAGCRALLARADVRTAVYQGRGAGALGTPLVLEGPVAGVRIESGGGRPWSDALDCRLAAALLGWAPSLRGAGVEVVRHLSLLRPGARVSGSGRVSGHAKGLAIDVARLALADGRVVEVERDWPKRRGAPPCPDAPQGTDEAGRLLVALVCGAVEAGLFQMAITPNHDRAHHNHVHLEVVPEWRDFTWVR